MQIVWLKLTFPHVNIITCMVWAGNRTDQNAGSGRTWGILPIKRRGNMKMPFIWLVGLEWGQNFMVLTGLGGIGAPMLTLFCTNFKCTLLLQYRSVHIGFDGYNNGIGCEKEVQNSLHHKYTAILLPFCSYCTPMTALPDFRRTLLLSMQTTPPLLAIL